MFHGLVLIPVPTSRFDLHGITNYINGVSSDLEFYYLIALFGGVKRRKEGKGKEKKKIWDLKTETPFFGW